MSSDGGDVFSQALNVATQFSTFGTMGFENGKLGNGFVTNAARDLGRATVAGTKEITGAAAAEQANRLAREQFEEQKALADADRLNQQKTLAKDQMNQSMLAGAARNAGSNRNTVRAASLGSDERDFLGL